MTFSNRLLLAAAALSALSACDGRRESKNDGEATFRVESVSMVNKSLVSRNKAAQMSTMRFQFQACVTDAVSRSPIAMTDFLVSDGAQSKTSTTEPSGCFLWSETHDISALAKERVMRVRRFFTSSSGFKGKVAVDLGFNPKEGDGTWYDLRKYNDLPNVEESVNSLPFNGRIESKLSGPDGADAETYLTSASFGMRKLDKGASEVNRLLTLTTVQKFDLTLEPQYRLTNLQGELVLRPMSAGRFKLSVTIVRENMGVSPVVTDLIAAYDGEVSVREDGKIRQEIALRVYDLAAALNHNNQLILTLEPMDEAAVYSRAGTYVGFLDVMNANSFDVKLDPAGIDGEKKRSATETLRQMIAVQPPSAMELLKTRYEMTDVSGSSFGNVLLNHATELKPLVVGSEMGGTIVYPEAAYCKDMYSENEVVEVPGLLWGSRKSNALIQCKLNTPAYIVIQDKDVVEEITGKPVQAEERQQVQKTITLSNTVSFVNSTDLSWGGKFSASAGASIDAGAVGPKDSAITGGVKLSIGAEVFMSTGYVHTEAKAKAGSVSTAQQLFVYSDSYDIPARVRRCVFMRGTTKMAKHFIACEEQAKDKVLAENFYTVNYNLPRSGFQDDNSLSVQRWRISMRGDDIYRSFERLVTTDNGRLSFMSLFSAKKPDPNFLPDFKISQDFPGVYSVENAGR